MKVKTEERLKIEALDIGKTIYFRKGKAIPVSGYVNRLNEKAKREGRAKENLNPYSFRDDLCDKKGFVSVIRNY